MTFRFGKVLITWAVMPLRNFRRNHTMSRRKKRPAVRNSEPLPKDPPGDPAPIVPLRKRKWLLAVTALLQAGWLAFLIVVALK